MFPCSSALFFFSSQFNKVSTLHQYENAWPAIRFVKIQNTEKMSIISDEF